MLKRLHSLFCRFLPELRIRMAGDLGSEDRRGLRAEILREQAGRLSRIMARMGYRHALVVRAGEDLAVESQGVRLLALGTDRYLKSLAHGWEGNDLLETLRARGIEPRSVVDVGANMGEISLCFARHCPGARVLAVEAAPETLELLRRNLAAQSFDTGRITLVPAAVADRPGTVRMSTGLGSENTITGFDKATDGARASGHMEVPAETLDGLMDRHGFDRADFLKVDIEGAEPLLAEALAKLAGRIRMAFIEFGLKNGLDAYLGLAARLLDSGYVCLGEDADQRLDLDGIRTLLEQARNTGKTVCLWFEHSGAD